MSVVKTEMGQRVMKDRSVPLTPRQRSAFILFDGKRSVDQVLAATASMGVTREDIDHLFGMDLLADGEPQVTAAAPVTATAASPASTAVAAVASAAAPTVAGTDSTPAAAAVPDGALQHKQRTAQERYAQAYLLATQITARLGLRGFRLNLAVEAAGSYEQLLALAPRIKDAVGPEKYAPLDYALNDR